MKTAHPSHYRNFYMAALLALIPALALITISLIQGDKLKAGIVATFTFMGFSLLAGSFIHLTRALKSIEQRLEQLEAKQ